MHYLYSLYFSATINLYVFWTLFFFHPTPTPLFYFSGGQQSELDVRVECGPADKSQCCSECAGGSGRTRVKVVVVRDFVKMYSICPKGIEGWHEANCEFVIILGPLYRTKRATSLTICFTAEYIISRYINEWRYVPSCLI